MYQTLYRKYRPSNFNEVIGQEIIVKTLKNAIKRNTISHAYLFTGPRGTGKTSVAKILGKTVNCTELNNFIPCNNCVNCTQNNNQSIDIIEIDAASNNGIDEIRELKSKVNLVPAYGKYKIYIVDEAHMLTTGAFNALLKTLEEPPEHIIFILATTEPYKIPGTILSRCQRFDFKKISIHDIYEYLILISKRENLEITDEALQEIANASDGGMRDALSLMDQVIAYSDNKITLSDVHEINGTISIENINQFFESLHNKQIEEIFEIIDIYNTQGKNFNKLVEELILYLKEKFLNSIIKKESFFELSNQKILELIKIFNNSINNIKLSQNPKMIFEITILEIINIDEQIEKKKPTKNNIVLSNMTEETNIEQSIPEEQVNISHELKNIRINNTLCNFNKKHINNWEKRINELEKNLLDSKYSQYIVLILDGKIKAASANNIIFLYKKNHMVDLFNSVLNSIDEVMNKSYNEKIYCIAVNENEWDNIKKEYNSKSKKYEYNDNQKISVKEDQLKDLFGDIVEYEN